MPNKLWLGLILGFALPALLINLSRFINSELQGMFLVGVGLAQFIVTGPLLVIARKQGKNELFKGLLIAAGIVFLLNAACFGLLAFGGLGGL